MKLANIETATVPASKVRDYLLPPSHPIGRYKAAFFRSLGYDQSNWEALATSLQGLLKGDAKQIGITEYGVKYEISGSITGPNGQTANVLSA